MTISAVVLEAGPFSGNGVTTAFPFTFKCFSKSEMIWTKTDAAAVEHVLVLDLDYSVALNVDQNTTPGGTITFPLGGSAYAILAAGEKLVGVSNAPETQLVDLVAAGGWFPEVVENALDRAVMLIQQLSQLLNRAIVIPASVSGVSTQTPAPAPNTIFGWNAAGTALVNYVIQAGTSLVDLAASGGSALIGFLQTGTGAVLRTVQSKLRDTISVKDYGAVGDGVVNDTVAIQACLTANAGKKIKFPAGNYAISATLAIPSNTELFGDSASYDGAGAVGTRISLLNNVNGNMFQNSNLVGGNEYITIRDMYLNGNSANQASGHGIYLKNSNYCRVENVKANFIKEDFIKAELGGVHWFHDNMCMNVNVGIELLSSADNDVSGNQITTSGASHGILLLTGGARNIIRNNFVFLSNVGIYLANSNSNHILGNRCGPNKLEGIRLDDADHNVITGNRCFDNTSSLAGSRAGIYVNATSEKNVITGNDSTNEDTANQVTGLRIESTSFHTLATGNMLMGNVSNAILFQGGQHANGNMVWGNYCTALVNPVLAINSTAPSVRDAEVFRTGNTLSTVINALADGTVGKRVTININDNLTGVDFTGTTLKGNNGKDWSPVLGDAMTCTFDGTNWYCIVSNNNRPAMATQGAAVASTNNLALGTDGSRFQISGGTQINLLDSSTWQGGAIVTLHFQGGLTVKHNQAPSTTFKPFMLTGAVDFVATANDQLTLQYDSTDTKWYELARAVI